MIMRLLLICITVTALLQWTEATDNQDQDQEVGFQAPENQSKIFIIREIKPQDSGEPKEPEAKPENQTAIQPFPPIRCLGCDRYCESFDDGKGEDGKGTRMCLIEPGVVHGCISIFMYGLRRKCISEMDMDEKEYCRENKFLCITCFEPDCNHVNVTAYGLQKDGSAPFRTSLLLLLSSCLISLLVMRE